ncbi:MAG: orotidine-5'-phosphate decarboxylase [bacterium]|nr:orotidine-5'-phosphate decarboxylase [bacterium]
MKYEDRIEHTSNPTAKRLFELIAEKETNLAIAADVTDPQVLLDLVKATGDEICVLKTHIDVVTDYNSDLIDELVDLKEKHNFLIFEDRKFADIGNTVKLQYSQGVYHIVDWSDITNAHVVPGPGIIEGLREVGMDKGRGLLLLAEMSSAGNLATGKYTQKALEMAEEYSDFVIGFIGMKKLIDDPKFITMTPGVKLGGGGDGLKQQYNTPENAIAGGTDIIIVGRGIYEAEDVKQAAQEYRKAGWDAYLKTI